MQAAIQAARARIVRVIARSETRMRNGVRKNLRSLSGNYVVSFPYSVYVVVQFYPWFNFCSFCFIFIVIYLHKKEQRKIKIEQRIKLNYNIYNTCGNEGFAQRSSHCFLLRLTYTCNLS